jgi:hypothetical protein
MTLITMTLYPERCYAECHKQAQEFNYAKCHLAECRYAECRGAA